jgi:hypothetical protein
MIYTRVIMILLIDSNARNNAITRTSALLSLEFALATAAYGIVYFRKMGAITARVRIELTSVRTKWISDHDYDL